MLVKISLNPSPSQEVPVEYPVIVALILKAPPELKKYLALSKLSKVYLNVQFTADAPQLVDLIDDPPAIRDSSAASIPSLFVVIRSDLLSMSLNSAAVIKAPSES